MSEDKHIYTCNVCGKPYHGSLMAVCGDCKKLITPELKAKVVAAMAGGATVTQAANEFDVSPATVGVWKQRANISRETEPTPEQVQEAAETGKTASPPPTFKARLEYAHNAIMIMKPAEWVNMALKLDESITSQDALIFVREMKAVLTELETALATEKN